MVRSITVSASLQAIVEGEAVSNENPTHHRTVTFKIPGRAFRAFKPLSGEEYMIGHLVDNATLGAQLTRRSLAMLQEELSKAQRGSPDEKKLCELLDIRAGNYVNFVQLHRNLRILELYLIKELLGCDREEYQRWDVKPTQQHREYDFILEVL